MRKLASIQKITVLEPIADADLIMKASVLGWQLVVKKDEFKEGDLCVYCEIDSLFPDKPEFEFLKPRGMRIKTIRLKGQISQGICFPLSILPANFEIAEDADCTEALEITKYDPPMPACLQGVAKGNFPSFIPKTDETRIQVLQKVLDQCVGELCYITEKLDGSSATYFINEGEFGVCSRNLQLIEDAENTFWKIAKELDIESKLRALNRNIAIQGELIGEGVNGNKLNLKGHSVRFFSAFEIDHYRYMPYEQFIKFIEGLSLQTVPILDTDFALSNDIPSLTNMANIRSTINPQVWAEGLVFVPKNEQLHLELLSQEFRHGRVSFKSINPEFLIKFGE